jgi:predicted metalloprotease
VVESACGFAQSAVGPFYCPLDEKVYIDLSFYRDLRDSYGAPGDFAQAYVIGHEVGHHVQNQIGIMEQVNSAQQQARSQVDANRLSVMLELQADCFAGVWAYNADRNRDILEQGDIEEGLNAAKAASEMTGFRWSHRAR